MIRIIKSMDQKEVIDSLSFISEMCESLGYHIKLGDAIAFFADCDELGLKADVSRRLFIKTILSIIKKDGE
jgi:hypothetical protein